MIYFDNAATSKFKPKSVIKAVKNQLIDSANPGRSAHNDAIKASLTIFDTRQLIASSLNRNDNEVIFTSGCTEALNLAILGSQNNKHIVTTIYEHNSVLRPLYYLASKNEIKITVVEPRTVGDKIIPEDIENAVNYDTTMICVNHISNVTGTEQDLQAIGKIAAKKGIKLLVDAAQSYGHRNIDMKGLGIDMLAAAGHKGAHAPQGCGFLCVNNRIKLNPIRFGGTGSSSESVYQPKGMPEGFESGTLNTTSIAGLKEGLKWTFENQKLINDKIKNLSEELLYGLKNIKGVKLYSRECNGVISFNVKEMPSSNVSDILNTDYDIATRSGLHCAPLAHKHLKTMPTGTVRASIGYNNSSKDITSLLKAVENIVKIN